MSDNQWKNQLYFGDNLDIMRWYIHDKKMALLWAFFAVFVGGLIYLLWRPDTLRFFSWLDLVGLSAPVELIRSYSKHLSPFIPQWVVFSLPNGLWAFSYALIITHIWVGHNSIFKYFWLSSIPVVGLGYEISQHMGVISGTFCYQDLVLCVVGIFIGTTISISIKRRAKE